MQGKSLTAWRKAESTSMPATRGSSPGCQPAEEFAGVRVALKGPLLRHGMEQCFTHIARDRLASTGCQSPMAPSSHPIASAGRWSPHTPLTLQVKDSIPSMLRIDKSGAGSAPHNAHIQADQRSTYQVQNKEKILPKTHA